MSCTRISLTGGAESLLYKDLYEKIADKNETKADEMFTYFKSEAFIEDFGDYILDYKNNVVSDRINENGEPLLIYDEISKKHYYLNKNNEKVYYPLINRGLVALFSNQQIDKIASRLALNYFKGSNLDFNNIDFSNSEKLPNLSNFIQKQIIDKIQELNEKGGFKNKLIAKTLTESLNYIDEFSTNVEKIFKEMSISIEETDDVDGNIDITAGEELKDPAFNQHSAERNTKDSVSTNVKLRLSLLEDTNNIDPIWGEPVFLSRDSVQSDLQFILSDIVAKKGKDIFELQLNALSKVLDRKPLLRQLYNYLSDVNFKEEYRSEFSQAFNLLKNNHIVSNYSEVNGTVVHTTSQISDSGSKTTTIKEQWDSNFQDKFLNKDNTLKENVKQNLLTKGIPEIKSIYEEILEFKRNFNNLEQDIQIETFENVKLKLFTFLDKLGITTDINAVENYLDNYGEFLTIKDKLNNLVTLAEQSQYLTNGIITKYESPTKDYSSFLTLSQSFTNLAKSEAFFLTDGSDATIRTGDKQKWIYSYPSYIATKVKQWKANPELLLELYNSSSDTKGSYYMGILTGSIDVNSKQLTYKDLNEQLEYSKKILEKLDVGIMNQMSADGKFKTTTDLAYSDYIVDVLNKVLKGDDFIRTTTQADKTTEFAIKTGIKVSSYAGVKTIVNEKGEEESIVGVKNQTKDVFFNYFASQVNRMIEANQEVENAKLDSSIKLTPHYHYKYDVDTINKNPEYIYSKNGNAFNFQYFEKLSFNAKNKSPLEKQISELIFDKEGNVLFNKLTKESSEELYDLFSRYLELNLFNSFVRTRSYLTSMGILNINEKGDYVINKIDNNTVTKTYSKIHEAQKPYAVVMDYLVNNLISNIEYSKMFAGDVAYYKNMIDYKKRIPATYTDGLQLRIKEGQEYFNIATINSVNRKSPFYDKLVESLGEKDAQPYEKINSADAQAWITPQRWKFLIQGLGKWSKAHDEVYRKMMSDKVEEYSEKELKIAAQPLKGVFFGRDATGKPTYLKYSQAVLSKALIQGSDLETMYNKMIDNNVDELITFDGVKVGAIEPTQIHDENGNILEDFPLNVQTLSNRDWKLQQDLPTKTFKNIDVGSQIQKNIFAGLRHNETLDGFMLDGKSYTGKQIMDEIVKTVSGLSDKGLKSLKEEFNIGDDYKIGNISGFYKSLIRELEQRGGSENVIKALETETTIVGIPQSAGKLYNIFASIMKSRLIKIKTNGGAFIQMSNFGLNKSEVDSKGVIWSPNALETVHEPHMYIDPDTLRRTVRPGGILVSGSFIAKYIPNWKTKTPEQIFGYTNENGEFVKGLIDPKILDNIIGYRIPNQGLASNDALQIVGILPESAGDTIVAYTGITTKTGSDKR
jgi:hypothetical protein